VHKRAFEPVARDLIPGSAGPFPTEKGIMKSVFKSTLLLWRSCHEATDEVPSHTLDAHANNMATKKGKKVATTEYTSGTLKLVYTRIFYGNTKIQY
jgi:hypothetical protein